MEINIVENVEFEHLLQAQALEEKYYHKEHVTPATEAWTWHEAYPWIEIFTQVDGKVAGFLDFYPIKDRVYQEFISGTHRDDQLGLDEIVNVHEAKSGTYKLLLLTLLVDEKYRGLGLLRTMFKSMLNFYDNFQKKGIYFDEIIVENVSQEGRAFSEKNGFIKVMDTEIGTTIYKINYKDFRERMFKL